MLTINFKGTEYNLSASLRVAYKFQGMNNHAPYGELLTTLGKKPLEDQISLVYCSLICANPLLSATVSQSDFLNYILDNYNAKDIMRIDGAIINAIFGVETEVKEQDKEVDVPDKGNFPGGTTV